MQLRIFVKTNANKDDIAVQPDGVLLVKTKAKPIDGGANATVIKLLSKYLKVPKSSIHIKNGLASHHKTIIVDDTN